MVWPNPCVTFWGSSTQTLQITRALEQCMRHVDRGLRLCVLGLVVGGLGYLGYAIYDFFYGPVLHPTSCLRSTPLDDVKLARAICQGQVPSPPCPHSLLQYYCNGSSPPTQSIRSRLSS
jgi:hypothetical protein